MRYLAVDLGEKRTGLAVGGDDLRLASPLAVLTTPRGAALIEAICAAARDAGADAIVLGLPVNMNGSEGEQAKGVRQFGDALARATDLPVCYQDERLTSYAADQRMARSGRTRGQKKQLRDALAAAEILRDFLEANDK